MRETDEGIQKSSQPSVSIKQVSRKIQACDAGSHTHICAHTDTHIQMYAHAHTYIHPYSLTHTILSEGRLL